MEYLAHIAEDGREQTVEEHLRGTAELSAAFAAAFHAEEHGRLAGLAHDIGKYSEGFQKRLHGGPKVDHATAGAIECAKLNCMMDACAVIGHHSGLPDFGNLNTDQPGDSTFAGRIKKGIGGGIDHYDFHDSLNCPSSDLAQTMDLLSVSFWTRMLYSCLLDADYLDTEAFMSGKGLRQTNYDSLPDLLKKLETYIAPWWPPKNELNARRCKILKSCLEGGQVPKGIYTLTVPTGGGKTVASLAFALKHAVHHGMKRIIYVIPYTSIIEQNARVFQKILGEKNVVEHHCNLVFDTERESDSDIIRKRQATENWDAPVIVTTAVQFFESMYASKSSRCRKLHNIANSVIIFDEAQMIPMEHLKPCVAAIGNLAAHFGSTAVLCTATQPVLNDLVQKYAPGISVRELCPGTADLYEQFRRVTFQKLGKLTEEELAQKLSKENQVLCIVNRRKTAQAVYDRLPPDGSYHLSTLMYPSHRQTVLDEIRERLKVGKPCRVVSTSLIEAGVDVDFPAVYRELSGLDSILQAAGRCNREGKRKAAESVVSIFEGEIPAPLLFRMNIGACREALQICEDPGTPEAVKQYFTSLRSIVGDHMDKSGTVEALSRGIAGCMLPFETMAQNFHLIDNVTKTVYIPIDQGAALIEQIRAGTANREVYRAAGRYSVSVYDVQYQKLLAMGALEELDEESAVLTDLNLYSRQKGLSFEK